jgi:hypothetical protein
MKSTSAPERLNVATSSLKPCRYCSGKELRRVSRRGYFQRVFLPKLGIFPWECVLCRHKYFLRDDGHKIHRREEVRN